MLSEKVLASKENNKKQGAEALKSQSSKSTYTSYN